MPRKTPPVSRIVSLVAKFLKAALNGSFARLLRTRPSHQRSSRPSTRPKIRRLGSKRAASTSRRSVAISRKGRLAGAFLIGAPRFELGTSSPPDCSAFWREVRASGARWLGYPRSPACLRRVRALASSRRDVAESGSSASLRLDDEAKSLRLRIGCLVCSVDPSCAGGSAPE
jgi:hypothetical protein